MLKKILIALLIVALLVSGGVYYSYKKLEAKFESIMFAEVEKKRAEAEKALVEKLKLQEPIDSTEDEVVPEIDEEVEDLEVVIEAAEDVSEAETSDDDTVSEPETIPEETTTSEPETTPKEETVVQEETVVEEETVVQEEIVVEVEVVEPEPVEIYTEEDFERDKKIALDLAMSRLTTSQLSRLIDLSDEGFTSEEKVEAKDMFYSNFSQAEQDWILGIYDKYYDLVNEV
jgi:FtsZ-interacting cell division protein ZipA